MLIFISSVRDKAPGFSRGDYVTVPVVIVHSEHDEFIKREHAVYLAQSLPHAEFVELLEVSHFAPLQRPDHFNRTMLAFLAKIRL